MKKIIKTILGLAIAAVGLSAMMLGSYLLLSQISWTNFGIFVPLFCVGFLIAYVGYDLMRGRSIKDDLFFLFS